MTFEFHFKRDKPAGFQTVLDVANQLGISEYRLFELAYVDWAGHDPDPKIIDHSFGIYMFEGIAPPYVVRFARRIQEGLETGSITRDSLGISPRYQSYPEQRRIGYLILTLLGAVFALLFAVVHFEAASGAVPTCILPPCV